MLDRQLLRTQPDEVARKIARKGVQAPIQEFLAVDQEFRSLQVQVNEWQSEGNTISKSIGALMGQGKKDEAEAAKAKAGELKVKIQEGEARFRELEEKLHEIELKFPNIPHDTVPDGSTSEENVEIRSWGEQPKFGFEPLPHWELGEKNAMLDFPRGAKITGSGFPLYMGAGARLQRALIQFMLDHQVERRGYTEVYPPYLVNRDSLIGTGNLPKFEEDLYRCDADDLFLIPTAEVPVTNIFRDEILEHWQLPTKFAAYTACFRREAGSAGKDTRGLLRIHQFDKIELVKFVLPESSYDELESLTEDAESVLQALGLHYRVLLLCAGDMGEKGCKCYDLEVWSPGVGRYLEISSCTNFEDYQSRRARIRFRREAGGKAEFVHILNGSGLATPRLFSALMETYQQADGSIIVPDPLRRYVGTDLIEPGV